jgi:tRNA(fMet)-specific endonuclease VapC
LNGWLIDTNALIDLVRSRPTVVTDRYVERSQGGGNLFTSTVSLFEFEFGMRRSDRHSLQNRALGRLLTTIDVLPFTYDDASAAAHVKAALVAKGQPIGAYDLLIAGQALARNLTVVTSNIREFSRVEGLTVEDWRSPA